MRLLVVINPSAHDFEAERRWPRMEKRLKAKGEVTRVKTVADDAQTLELVKRALATEPDRVVAIGGDGTVRMVVSAMMRAGLSSFPEFAVIPFGTANNVAKSLGLPLDDLDALADAAVGDRLARLDVGWLQMDGPQGASEHVWTNCVSVGMDADIVESRTKFRKLGSYLSYAAALAERTLEQRSMDMQVQVDGVSRGVRVFNAVVTNVPLYAGFIRMPGARMDDGLLDLYLFDRNEYASKVLSFAVQQADMLKLGVGDFLDELTQNQRSSHGKRIHLRLAYSRPVQVDGDAVGEATELDFRIVGQLAVAAP